MHGHQSGRLTQSLLGGSVNRPYLLQRAFQSQRVQSDESGRVALIVPEASALDIAPLPNQLHATTCCYC